MLNVESSLMPSMGDFYRSNRLPGVLGNKEARQLIENHTGFHNLVTEMRFDEASARFADFGAFYVGNRLESEQFQSLITGA